MSYLAARVGSTIVVRPEMSWPLWPGCVLLVSVLLLVRRSIWPLLITAAFAAFVLWDLQDGISLRSISLLILSDIVEVLTAALCLSYSFGGTPKLSSVKALAKYSFFAVILAPFLAAFIGAFAFQGEYWASWKISFFSEALGFLIVVPAILGWFRKIQGGTPKPLAYYLEATALLGALVVLGYFTFIAPGESIPPALFYSSVPFLLWSALRFESIGVATSVLVVSFLSIWGAVHGRGPFVGPGPLKNVFSLQLFLFFTAAPFMVLAALVEERKAAGRALKKSEEKFSKTFRESPLAFTLTSAKDYRYIEVNETFERISGWGRDEVLGRTPFDFGIWVDPGQRQELMRELLAGGIARNFEHRFKTKDGEVRTGLGSSELIEIDGEPCVVTVVADITEHKQVQEKLRASQSRLEGIVASAMDAIIAVDEDQRIVVFNEAAEKMFGCPAPNAIGTPIARFIPERFRAAHGIGDFSALWAHRATGEEFPIEASISQTEAGGKKLFTVIIRDITERKQAEEARYLHAAIVDSTDDAIVSKNLEGVILSWNSGARRFFGFTEAEAVGRPITIIIPDELHEEENEILRKIKKGEHVEHYETVRIKKGGERLNVSLTISPLRDWNGKIIGASKIARDITERKRFEESLLWRLQLESLLSDLSTTFINLPEEQVDANLETSLDRVGEFLKMDRITLFEFSPDGAELETVFSWAAPGVTPAPNLAASRDLPWWRGRLWAGEVSLASDVNDLPEEAYAEKEYFRQRGIVAAASVPLKLGGEVVGAISFVTAQRQVAWTEDLVNQLRTIGEIFWNALKRKRVMAALLASQAVMRESEERFRLVANTAPVMIWMSGPDKLCNYFNQTWLEFTGRSIESEMGNGWAEGVHPEDFGWCLDTYTKNFDNRKSFQMEYRLRRHDGEYRWILDLGVPRWNADGSFAGYIGSCLDVSERKRADEALSSVSRRLIEAHEEERTWIARELHDDINQRMALLAVNLERMQLELPASAASLAQSLAEMSSLVSELSSDVQALSHRLHSSKLEYLGIGAAAASFCRELSRRQGVEIDFHCEDVPRDLPQEVALCLFRVLQEAVQNALKHSGSRSLEVSLVRASNAVQLTVRDSGIGFDPEEALKGQGLGLTSMKERLKLIRGDLSIDSAPQRGTLIRATAPLAPMSMAAQA